ncbi:MAG: O-antigen ligase family protein [Rhodomicrobium sp.]
MLFYLCGVVLASAVIAGGGTHNGFLGDVAIQLLAIPLLCMALWPAFSAANPHRKRAQLALALCGIAAFTAAIELLPLPFAYWSGSAALPAADAAGTRTISLTPAASWAAALSLIVPLSIFGSAIQLRFRQRLSLAFLLAGLGAASLALGFLQVAQGQASGLRFYAITNPTEAVGFFANRNHFAALLNVTLVLAAVWLWIAADASLKSRTAASRSILWFAAATAFLVADVAGLAMARSRAGMLFAMLALAGIVAMALKQRHLAQEGRRRLHAGRVSFAAALFAVLFAIQFGLGSMLSRFEGDPLEDLRFALNRTTFSTVFDTLPFGTGLGSFVRVYATVEKQQDVFAGFANRAHDDLAELLLETGFIGACLLLTFLAWYAMRSFRVWRTRQMHGDAIEPMLERAASLIIGLLLLHSLVDYPLRTAALGAIFAFFCAILAVPAPANHEREKQQRHPEKPRVPARLAEKWGGETGWPESWQRKEP